MSESTTYSETHPDYYALLEVERNADIKTISRVYRLLALRYHPDNPQTGDVELFLLLSDAYKILSDPASRADYDKQFEDVVVSDSDSAGPAPLPVFLSREFTEGLEAESKMRLGIMSLLYLKRRSDPDKSSVSLLELENMMAIPREHLRFALWYLKQKKFVLQDDRSSFMVSAEGVEHLEGQMSKETIVEKILQSQPSNSLIRLKNGTGRLSEVAKTKI